MTWRWALLCLVLAVGACRAEREEEEEEQGTPSHERIDAQGRVVLSQKEREAIGLLTARAEQGSLTVSDLRFGKVVARPDEDAVVVAPVTGRLVAPVAALGSTVKEGDKLLELEPLVDTASQASLQAQRRELQGQLEGARAEVLAKRSDLERVATLVSSGLATEADRAQAQASLTSEEARAESLKRANADLTRMTGGRIELRAPVLGVVATLVSDVGSVIQQGTILARIVRAGPRWIDIAVPPGDRIGSGYRARGIPETVDVELLTRGAVVQSDGTRRDRLQASQDAAGNLPPGATIAVEVLHETRGVTVPAFALVRRGDETLVFVQVQNGRYGARKVQIAARDEVRAVVQSGIAPGDVVVTRGAASLLGELGARTEGESQGEQE